MASNDKQKEIVVAGDVAVDWHIVNFSDQQKQATSNEALPSRIFWEFGGSLLLTNLISETVNLLKEKGQSWNLHRVSIPRENVYPDDDRYITSYASWSISPKTNSPEDKRKSSIWRVKEFLGVSQAIDEVAVSFDSDSQNPDIIVLDDANLGFRNDKSKWPMAITNPKPGSLPWIVVKMSKPLAQGALWDELYEKWSERLILILNVKDLRLSEVQISSELSWERTAQDVAWELMNNPRINSISRCAYVIVSFSAAGAMCLKKTGGLVAAGSQIDPPECTLLFDPQVIEGMWEQNHPGKMIGYNTCITSSIVRELMISPEKPDLVTAVRIGLCALRDLHENGYEYQNNCSARACFNFPYQRIAQIIENCDGKPFGTTSVQIPTRLLDIDSVKSEEKPVISGTWTILQQQAGKNELEGLASRILNEGAESALKNVPMGKFGNLLTVDRREIESFRNIRRLVNGYCCQEKFERPLSMAVFGPPGSGKSFGIAQVAKSLRPDEIEKLTFNLSQFGSIEELVAAFHKIRDLNLSGKTPLVFWDEFDSVFGGIKFGWLRYFLVPMQDGEFSDGRTTHPIGKAIFVFAGGIFHSMELFVRESQDQRDAKAPDFISRLRGYVNILGANPPDDTEDKKVSDPFYQIRRAILLRSILWQNVPQIFSNRDQKGRLNIDNGILRALLKTRCYKHGARSMEAIIGMSNLAGKTHFDQSSLPPETQLDLHVDGQDFLSLIQEIVLEGETLERLAAANHEIFCEKRTSEGYRYGTVRDNNKKTHPLLLPYQELSEFDKEKNRSVIRSMAEKLKNIGFVMLPARSNEQPFNFPGGDLEKLAKMEHDRYIREAVSNGWSHGSTFDETKKINTSLLPWKNGSEEEIQRYYPGIADKIGREELPEDEKEKDRTQVRGYPEILKRAGYTIVKLKRSSL